MADKLIQKVTNKTTGAPIINATVLARPVTAAGTEADISMPETPAKSGIYATASQVNHETYKIIVGGVDSQDERTVEPGRVKVRGTGGNLVYPLIDRLLDAKLFLKGLISDSKASADATDLRSAILAATHNASVKRTLVLDQDASLDLATAVTQDLHLDLNSMTLTLNADMTSGSSIITVYNGKINVNASVTILGTIANFVNCEFIGTGVGQFMRSAAQSFTGCSGLTEHAGTNVDGVDTAAIAGGSHAFGHSAKLKLTTKGSKSGSGRLNALQGWIDSTLSDSFRMNILTWLFGNKDALAEWVDLDPLIRQNIAGSTMVGDPGKRWFPSFQRLTYRDSVSDNDLPLPSNLFKAGVSPGIKVITSDTGAIVYAHVVALTSVGSAVNAIQDLKISGEYGVKDYDNVWRFLNGSYAGNLQEDEVNGGSMRLTISAWKINSTHPLSKQKLSATTSTRIVSQNIGLDSTRIALLGIGTEGLSFSPGDLILVDIEASMQSSIIEPNAG